MAVIQTHTAIGVYRLLSNSSSNTKIETMSY